MFNELAGGSLRQIELNFQSYEVVFLAFISLFESCLVIYFFPFHSLAVSFLTLRKSMPNV